GVGANVGLVKVEKGVANQSGEEFVERRFGRRGRSGGDTDSGTGGGGTAWAVRGNRAGGRRGGRDLCRALGGDRTHIGRQREVRTVSRGPAQSRRVALLDGRGVRL